MPTPFPNASDLGTAIENFRKYTLESFNTAMIRARETPPTNPSAEALAKWNADTAKAKAEVTSSLQQLIQADTMLSEKRNREGFDDLMTIVDKAREAAEKVFTRIGTLAADASGTASDQTNRNLAIRDLAGAVTALANIVPVEVWQKGSNA
jgi:hypothetical protein